MKIGDPCLVELEDGKTRLGRCHYIHGPYVSVEMTTAEIISAHRDKVYGPVENDAGRIVFENGAILFEGSTEIPPIVFEPGAMEPTNGLEE